MTQQEFEILYQAMTPKLKRLARQFSIASDTAMNEDDIAQESMIALWQLAQKGYPIRQAEALAVRIAKNICISKYRQQKLTILPIEENDQYEGGDEATKLTDEQDDAELRQNLYGHLTPEERKYMHLKVEEDLSLDQIEALTGKGKPAIKSALSKARKKLKEQLKKLSL